MYARYASSSSALLHHLAQSSFSTIDITALVSGGELPCGPCRRAVALRRTASMVRYGRWSPTRTSELGHTVHVAQSLLRGAVLRRRHRRVQDLPTPTVRTLSEPPRMDR